MKRLRLFLGTELPVLAILIFGLSLVIGIVFALLTLLIP